MADNKEKVENQVDKSDGDEMEDEEVEGGNLAQEVLKRPDILAYLQDQLMARDYVRSLPAPVRRRIKALKKYQAESIKIEAKFYEEVHKLECLYHSKYFPLIFHTRKFQTKVSGESCHDDLACLSMASHDRLGLEAIRTLHRQLDDDANGVIELSESDELSVHNVLFYCHCVFSEDKPGIPGFWLTVFHNVSMLSDMVQVYDEPILKHLLDVRVIILEKDPMGFVLEFHFSKNPYFSNTLLTKEYIMKCEPDENDPFSFEGPEIYKCVGCKIDWYKDQNVTVKTVKKKQKHKSKGNLNDENDPFSFEGPEIYKCVGCKIDWYKDQNVTVKTVKKKQKHKSKGQIRIVNKTEPNDSFFNFFNPPTVPEDPNAEIDEETQALLSSDFEIGHYIRERVIPRAVLYFTGEAMDDDLEEEELEEEEEDDEEDEDEEEASESDEDEDTHPPPHHAKRGKGKGSALKGAQQGQQQDCKQQ
ncbi:nucleosome assembly protein 1-like 1 [Diaphorina citri]|uniref:Nucleosome assembly protein 1-like 1 n=1 Tax=Diaphorina citri TaxID=121845 RepID=A0A3Q0JB91_DIACI|nr:nucleosome assembly protein 1-like 1 [Diaphorina citri]